MSEHSQTECAFQKTKPHKSPEIPHIYYFYLLLLMSLLGSVQRKLQALQKIWQEDARRKNGGEKKHKKTFLTEASYPALATIYIFEITANKMEIPLKWNKLFSEIPI